jgi:hypothetical protein
MSARVIVLTSLLFLYGLTLFSAACEKSDSEVLQEQLEQSRSGCERGCTDPRPGCMIKGNISGAGNKFYLMPGTERYPLAIIEPELGERWFCTEQDALAAGFQPVPEEFQ